jgi:hypothetical protein
MGLFDFFKKRITIQDEFWGELQFIKIKNTTRSYFSGSGYFAPADKEIEFSIMSGEEGPSQSQREFYEDLQKNFDQYILKFIPRLEEEFRHADDDFRIRNFKKEFIPESLTIPTITRETPEWEICFSSVHDENHLFTISMTGDVPGYITIDG